MNRLQNDPPVGQRKPYQQVNEEQEQQEEDEDTMTLTFDEKLKVWIDEETQLYYEDAEGTDAKGSIVNGSLRPFKVVKKQQ